MYNKIIYLMIPHVLSIIICIICGFHCLCYVERAHMREYGRKLGIIVRNKLHPSIKNIMTNYITPYMLSQMLVIFDMVCGFIEGINMSCAYIVTPTESRNIQTDNEIKALGYENISCMKNNIVPTNSVIEEIGEIDDVDELNGLNEINEINNKNIIEDNKKQDQEEIDKQFIMRSIMLNNLKKKIADIHKMSENNNNDDEDEDDGNSNTDISETVNKFDDESVHEPKIINKKVISLSKPKIEKKGKVLHISLGK